MILRPVGDRTGWWFEGAVALFLVAFPALLAAFGAGTDLGTRILILGLFGIGVDLIFGYTGLLSFGQAAFYGTGGFVTAHLLIAHVIPNSLGALVAGTLVAALFGALIGSLALRQVGIYFSMLTLAFGQLFYFLENSPLRAYTGSENGLPGVPKPSIPLGPLTLDFSSSLGTYVFVAVIYFGGFFIARRIVFERSTLPCFALRARTRSAPRRRSPNVRTARRTSSTSASVSAVKAVVSRVFPREGSFSSRRARSRLSRR